MKQPIVHEPYTAPFTGQQMTYTSSEGQRYVFSKPGIRVKKDQTYMVEIDPNKNTCRMIPVIS